MIRAELSIEEEGFAAPETLTEHVDRIGEQAFVDLLEGRPALVGPAGSEESAEPLSWTKISEAGDEPPPSEGDCVALVAKRPGNPFPAMVTLGRAKTCDLVLQLSTVSKIHAYFLREKDSWAIVDQHSLNKTFLNGEEIAPGLKHPIRDGDRLRFGTGPEFAVLSPDSLLTRLRVAPNGV